MTNYQPYLIILDVVMGGKSSFKFCLQPKKSKQTCSIPVIICSTKTTQADLMLENMIAADSLCSQNRTSSRIYQQSPTAKSTTSRL